jgi:hypothetical protein
MNGKYYWKITNRIIMVLTGTLLFEECTTFQTAYRIIMVNEIIVKYAWISTPKAIS